MSQESKYYRSSRPFQLTPRWRWIFWPVVGLSGRGTALTLWLREEAIMLEDCAPIAAIPGMAALLYWFNHIVFKAAMPRREDLSSSSSQHNLLDKTD